ncbi:CHASE2 domain-containing protein [Lyngbya aestuarii]|uniref:CHASE2 domain-containing protein n=1 Tax=Lyngbya aestuarii TaxID=118322 RepID=UPI00403DE171
MNQLAVLELKGNLNNQGFYVTLHLSQGDLASSMTIDGYLPPSTLLFDDLIQWQQDYRRLATPSRAIKPYKIKYDGTINPLEACRKSAQQLGEQFQSWLRSESFRDVELRLRQVLMPDDSVQVLIRTANAEVQALPWHLWDFIEQYPKAEIALSGGHSYACSSETNLAASDSEQVNILAVLGDRTNIDIESDCQTLNQLPGARVEFLVEPTHQELNDILYEQSWDILFFAGHSETKPQGEGVLRLNSTTHLTIDEVRYGVRRAIANGLQLAIFNSCDGLGLAQALAQLQLPQMIVMREIVPDVVAQQFLKYFLGAFSQGQSLHLAQREARERLQGMEKNYPCASWLPVIYQPLGRTLLSWHDLQQRSLPLVQLNPLRRTDRLHRQTISRTALVSFIFTSLVMGVRFLGGLQLLEFWTFDRLMRLRPAEGLDERILLVTIDEADLRYQDEQGYERDGSLSNQALAIALQKLKPYDPVVVGVDIFRERPVTGKFKPVVKAIKSAQTNHYNNFSEVDSNLKLPENTIFTCQVEIGEKLDTIYPPPSIELVQLGFSNIVSDPDKLIRRHLIGMSPDTGCNTDKSFSYQVAGKYLQHKSDFQATRLHRTLIINGVEFPNLNRHSGAYHSVEMGGYNTLLNYRATEAIAPTLSLSELLEGVQDNRLADLVSDRIILIGTIARSFGDYHLTPYGEMAGVEVQAHMISQILSAVEDNRPLLRTLPPWGDVLLVYVGTLGIAGVMMLLRIRGQMILAVLATLFGLSVLCFLALKVGWWLPLIPAVIGCAVMTGFIQYSCTMQKQD